MYIDNLWQGMTHEEGQLMTRDDLHKCFLLSKFVNLISLRAPGN